jgi:Dolichyl-phosphate-mannose-protein mannosyltransferase
MHSPSIFSPRALVAHPLGGVFFLALSVRLLNLVLLKGDGSFFAEPDASSYWALGAALAKPDTFWPTLLAMTDRMPLYPLLLAAVEATVGDKPRAVAFIQAVMDAGTCALIAALGALISPLVGLIAGILAALSVTLIVFSSQVLTDTPFLFFFTAMLLAGARFLLRPSSVAALLAGLAGGLSIAVRPAALILLAAAVPVAFIVARARGRRLAGAAAAALLFAAGAAAPIAPVLLRNMIHYGTLSLTSQTGDHFAFWIVPLAIQRANGTPYQESVDRMRALYQRRLADHDPSVDADPFRRAAVLTQIAREEIAQVPRLAIVEAWLEGMVVNFGAPALLDDPRVRALPKPSFYNTLGANLWQRTRVYLFDDPGLFQVLLVGGLAGMLFFLALESIGFVMLAQTLPWAAVLAGGVLAYFILLNGPVIGPKYRLPMEPILIVLAAIPLAWLLKAVGSFQEEV